MEAVRWLLDSGLVVEQQDVVAVPDARADAVLVVTGGDSSARFAVELKQRAPYPN